MDSLCHPGFTTTNLSYRFPIFETSATALCGTTGTPECWSHIRSKDWSLFQEKTTSWPALIRERSNTRAEKPIQNSPVHKVPIPPLTRQDMQIEESSKGWLPSTFPKSHLQIYLVAETSETGKTNVKNAALSKWGPYEIPAAFIHSLDVGNRVWPPDSSSHAGDEETTTKWQENMIPNVPKNHTQLRNDHQRKNVKRSITARDRQQVQDTGSALWIEKFPEHIGHNQGQRAYHEQADQGCSQAPTQNYSFNSSAGVGYVKDETKNM